MPRLSLLVPVVLFLQLISLAASAQDVFVFRGRVVDSTAAAVPGARVTAGPQVTTTGVAGEFALAIPSSVDELTIELDGFAPAHVAIDRTGPTAVKTITLEVAALRDAVTVTAPRTYQAPSNTAALKTLTPVRDVPQSITVVTKELIADQQMASIADTVRYMPGISVHQGENNRDQVVIRGNNSSADFFVDGVRDDVQYYRDLYNLERIEAIKGPNATMFGRGGGGGVINRVTKEAGFMPLQEMSIHIGSYGDRRVSGDLDRALSSGVAFRLNGMYENDGSFRKDVTLERYAVNPTFTLMPDSKTKIALSYESLYDHRVSDRGVSSFDGRPLDLDPSTVYGNPTNAWVNARVNLASVNIEHEQGMLRVRNRTLVGNYDRGYQNYVPGAVTADGTQMALTAYNNATNRTNFFNQTDAILSLSAGRISHTLAAGVELGAQVTDNFRNTGYFNNSATSIVIPITTTLITTPLTFRQSATDADNHVRTNVAAVYAQEQVQLAKTLQVIAGLRYDYFDVNYYDNRTGLALARPDNLLSPRAAIVYKPIEPVSFYSSYTISYLPSAGDQFSSLTTVTQQVKPEQFTNYEVGVKWDARGRLSLTTAVYRLDRTNTRSTDPNDPARIIQTGSQRTSGVEFGVSGNPTAAWQIAGGYAYQNALITSPTTSAVLGAVVGQVPHHTVSLWNRYQLSKRFGAGLGIIYRSDMFAAIDDAVTLPGYVRFDGALFYEMSHRVRLQMNVENAMNATYFINADSNTNISPGSPRAVRVALVTKF